MSEKVRGFYIQIERGGSSLYCGDKQAVMDGLDQVVGLFEPPARSSFHVGDVITITVCEHDAEEIATMVDFLGF